MKLVMTEARSKRVRIPARIVNAKQTLITNCGIPCIGSERRWRDDLKLPDICWPWCGPNRGPPTVGARRVPFHIKLIKTGPQNGLDTWSGITAAVYNIANCDKVKGMLIENANRQPLFAFLWRQY